MCCNIFVYILDWFIDYSENGLTYGFGVQIQTGPEIVIANLMDVIYGFIEQKVRFSVQNCWNFFVRAFGARDG